MNLPLFWLFHDFCTTTIQLKFKFDIFPAHLWYNLSIDLEIKLIPCFLKLLCWCQHSVRPTALLTKTWSYRAPPQLITRTHCQPRQYYCTLTTQSNTAQIRLKLWVTKARLTTTCGKIRNFKWFSIFFFFILLIQTRFSEPLKVHNI